MARKTALEVKNYGEFQHYRDRQPPWIKFYYSTLTDYAFMALPTAAQRDLLLIWLLASRHGGVLPNDEKYIRNAIQARAKVDLRAMIDAGFLIEVDADAASKTLASCKQSARPEVEVDRETDKRDRVATAAAPVLDNAVEDQISQIIVAVNNGMIQNPKLRDAKPIMRNHSSRQHVADWLLDGIRYETIVDVVHGKAKEATSPIYSMAYFDKPVREAHETGISSAFVPPADSPARQTRNERPQSTEQRTQRMTGLDGTDPGVEQRRREAEESDRLIAWEHEHPAEMQHMRQAVANEMGAESWEQIDLMQKLLAIALLKKRVRLQLEDAA